MRCWASVTMKKLGAVDIFKRFIFIVHAPISILLHFCSFIVQTFMQIIFSELVILKSMNSAQNTKINTTWVLVKILIWILESCGTNENRKMSCKIFNSLSKHNLIILLRSFNTGIDHVFWARSLDTNPVVFVSFQLLLLKIYISKYILTMPV